MSDRPGLIRAAARRVYRWAIVHPGIAAAVAAFTAIIVGSGLVAWMLPPHAFDDVPAWAWVIAGAIWLSSPSVPSSAIRDIRDELQRIREIMERRP